MRQQPSVSAVFSKKRPTPDNTIISAKERKAKQQAWQTPCCGLNDETWLRPNSKYTIQNCIVGSTLVSHGAPRRDLLAQAIFKVPGGQLTAQDDPG